MDVALSFRVRQYKLISALAKETAKEVVRNEESWRRYIIDLFKWLGYVIYYNMMAAPFNAGSTVGSYYKAKVNHDMPQFS